jgi:hypothetical protein
MTPTMIRQLAALGLTITQIAGVMEIFDTDSAERRAKVAARMQRYRDGKAKRELNVDATTTLRSVTVDPRAGVTRVEDNLLTKSKTGQKDKKETFASLTNTRAKSDFDEWWELYPHKMQKAAAKKAWEKAVKRASLAELKEGVERYIRDKPPETNWRYPATWLNGDGWLDRPAPPTGNSIFDQLRNMANENGSAEETGNGDRGNVRRLRPRESGGSEGDGFPFLIDYEGKGH